MQPQIVMFGKPQPDNGEQWAFDNNHRMVDYEQPCEWDYRTDKPIMWEQITLPAPLFDSQRIMPEGVRNIRRRVPSPKPNGKGK